MTFLWKLWLFFDSVTRRLSAPALLAVLAYCSIHAAELKGASSIELSPSEIASNQTLIKQRYIEFLRGNGDSFSGTYGAEIENSFYKLIQNNIREYDELSSSSAYIDGANSVFSSYSSDDHYADENKIYSPLLQRSIPALAYAYTVEVSPSVIAANNGVDYYQNEAIKQKYLDAMAYLHGRGVKAGMTFHSNPIRNALAGSLGFTEHVNDGSAAALYAMHLRMGSYCQALLLMKEHIADEPLYPEYLATVGHMRVLGGGAGGTYYYLKMRDPDNPHRVQSDAMQLYPDMNLVYALLLDYDSEDPDSAEAIHEALLDAHLVATDSLQIVNGWSDTIKPDYTGFHHRALYGTSYTSGFASQAASFCYYLHGSDYAVSDPVAVENLQNLMKAYRLWHGKYAAPFGIRGRFPDHPSQIRSEGFLAFVVSAASNGLGQAEMVPLFKRLWDPDKIGPDIAFKGGRGKILQGLFLSNMLDSLLEDSTPAEPEPEGFTMLPYGGLALKHGVDGETGHPWMASVKGTSKYVWDYENSGSENIYGFFLSHGMLTIFNREVPDLHPEENEDMDSDVDSGYDLKNGWDWFRMPGTTSIRHPIRARSSGASHRDFSSESFLGAVSLDGENGAFGMILSDSETPHGISIDLSARKSYFFSDDLIVALGSGISASDEYGIGAKFSFTKDGNGISTNNGGLYHSFADTLGVFTLGSRVNDSIEFSFRASVATPDGSSYDMNRRFIFGLAGPDDKLFVTLDTGTSDLTRFEIGTVTNNAAMTGSEWLFRRPTDSQAGGALEITNSWDGYDGTFTSMITSELDATYRLMIVREEGPTKDSEDDIIKVYLSQDKPDNAWSAERTFTVEQFAELQFDKVFIGLQGGIDSPLLTFTVDNLEAIVNGRLVGFSEGGWRSDLGGPNDDTTVLSQSAISTVETTLFQNRIFAHSLTPRMNASAVADGTQVITSDSPMTLTDASGNGYYLPDASGVNLLQGTQNSYIDSGKKTSSGSYVTAWLDHGDSPTSAFYEYAILVNGEDEVEDLKRRPSTYYSVQRMDDGIHQVYFPKKNQTDTIFYEAGSNGGSLVEWVDTPCLVSVKANGLGWDVALTNPDIGLADESQIVTWSWVNERAPIDAVTNPYLDYLNAFVPATVRPVEIRVRGLWKLQSAPAEVELIGYESGGTRIRFNSLNSEIMRASLSPLDGSAAHAYFSQLVFVDDFEAQDSGSDLSTDGIWKSLIADPLQGVSLVVEQDALNQFEQGIDNQLLRFSDRDEERVVRLFAGDFPPSGRLRVSFDFLEPSDPVGHELDGDFRMSVGIGDVVSSNGEVAGAIAISNGDFRNTSFSFPLDEPHHVDWYLNESGSAMRYLDPNGLPSKLATGEMAIWVDGVKVEEGVSTSRTIGETVVNLSALRMETYTSAKQELLLDNIEIAIPDNLAPWKEYPLWAYSYKLSDLMAQGAADPDLDGYANLLEYALGLDPLVRYDGTPLHQLTSESSFRFEFRRHSDWELRGLSYQLQQTDNLTSGSWFEVDEQSLSLLSQENGFDLMRYEVPTGAAEDGGVFFRLTVDEN